MIYQKTVLIELTCAFLCFSLLLWKKEELYAFILKETYLGVFGILDSFIDRKGEKDVGGCVLSHLLGKNEVMILLDDDQPAQSFP